MAERQATVASSSGLHARPAKLFVQAVQQTGVPVTIAVEGGPDLNAGSILTLMGLGATQGTVVTLKAEGEGAERRSTPRRLPRDRPRRRGLIGDTNGCRDPGVTRVAASGVRGSEIDRVAGIERTEPPPPCSVAHCSRARCMSRPMRTASCRASRRRAGLHGEDEVDRLADLQPRRADRAASNHVDPSGAAYESPG
jgi:phosphocarrier protein